MHRKPPRGPSALRNEVPVAKVPIAQASRGSIVVTQERCAICTKQADEMPIDGALAEWKPTMQYFQCTRCFRKGRGFYFACYACVESNYAHPENAPITGSIHTKLWTTTCPVCSSCAICNKQSDTKPVDGSLADHKPEMQHFQCTRCFKKDGGFYFACYTCVESKYTHPQNVPNTGSIDTELWTTACPACPKTTETEQRP